MKLALKAALVALGVFAAGAAQAANAISTTNLNIRTGPGTRYATLGSIPSGAPVTVRGCASGYGWCQVSYGPTYGWASSRYLAFRSVFDNAVSLLPRVADAVLVLVNRTKLSIKSVFL